VKSIRIKVRDISIFLYLVGVLQSQIAMGQLLQGTRNEPVLDPSQAAVSGVTVTISNDATAANRTTTAGGNGDFSLLALPPGTYTLKVIAQGSQGYTRIGVVVNANEIARADVALVVGGVDQSVTVSSRAVTLQTDRADVHTDLTASLLSSLPLALGRNYQLALAVIAPGVSPPQSSGSYSANPSRAVGYSVNGVSAVTNTTRIDGTSSTDYNAPDKPCIAWRWKPSKRSTSLQTLLTPSRESPVEQQSSSPPNRFTVTDSNTTLNTTGSTQFADCVGPAHKLKSMPKWHDVSGVAHPTTGRFGTCPTNNLWGAWSYQCRYRCIADSPYLRKV
jgi:Carboxypeptidase regulatory-like domain